ncbi:hypothetical protein V1Y59_18535 [Gordonia sp. PKS22-38]|uniref:Uncharacterized protein n=1 Tax=Gordonia prachuapensis TaxID=3115651 RepID=A0ABU7MZA5_9ACTN|nr:hypothetical protein [Gordonia sp. PKS22-38]
MRPGTSTERRRIPRLPLWVIGAAVIVVILGALLWHGRSTMQERSAHETVATSRCEDAVRGELDDRLGANGQAAEVEFVDVDSRTTGVGSGEAQALQDAGRERAEIETHWAVTGDVTLDGELPSAARLGPTNPFRCTAAVLDDDSVVITGVHIN